jgi:N-acetylneuraminate synthase
MEDLPMRAFKISLSTGGDRWIGGDAPCFIIAEIGTNWYRGDREDDSHARHLIDVAAEAGCDAAKFQTFSPASVYVPEPGQSEYLREAGIKRSIREILEERTMTSRMLSDLAQHARDKGIVFMSSCFSVDELGLVDPLTPIHKLASYEVSHIRLIDALAATGKPVILSSGACTEDDIAWVVDRFRAANRDELVLMQCSAAYPTPDQAVNLRVIPWLGERFNVIPGLSDHTAHPLRAPLAAVAVGAKVIEKHVTLDRSGGGPDDFNSIEPAELQDMVAGIRAVEAMLGDGTKRIEAAETDLQRLARRGIQAIRDVSAGETLREGINIAILRPGSRDPGAHPREIDEIEGRRAGVPIRCGDGVLHQMTQAAD